MAELFSTRPISAATNFSVSTGQPKNKPWQTVIVWSVYAKKASYLQITVNMSHYVILAFYGINKHIRPGVLKNTLGKVEKWPRPFFTVGIFWKSQKLRIVTYWYSKPMFLRSQNRLVMFILWSEHRKMATSIFDHGKFLKFFKNSGYGIVQWYSNPMFSRSYNHLLMFILWSEHRMMLKRFSKYTINNILS